MKRKMGKNKVIILFSLLILLAGAFSAFSEEVTETPAEPSGQSEEVSEAEILSSTATIAQVPQRIYSYNPLGKPDPFKPFINVEVKVAQKGIKAQKKVESIFPLQRSEVESFRLVGIIGDSSRRLAIVEDSSKRFYPLFVGTHIGLRNGKVTDILSDRLTVDEPDGKKVKRIVLKLRKNI